MNQDKLLTASGYDPQWVENVLAACLYLATVLGDLLREHLVIVGGLAPGSFRDGMDVATSCSQRAMVRNT